MTERKPTGTNLALPKVFGSTSPNLNNNNRSFLFSSQPMEEESFEDFNFPVNLDLLGPIKPPRPVVLEKSQQLQQQRQQQQQQQQPPLPSVETIATVPSVVKMKRQTHVRNYKVYAGNSIFFCGGRFLTSRAFWAFCLSLTLLFAPCILFLIFT